MKYIVNVDVETLNISGGNGVDCKSALHEALGPHFDITIHELNCPSHNSRAVHREFRYWLTNGEQGYSMAALIQTVEELQQRHPNAYPRRCHRCNVDPKPPVWD